MKTAENFANELKQALGENLLSLVLHGSAASGDVTKKFSDIDLFVLLTSADLLAIKPALPLLRRWVKQGHKAPVLLSLAHFQNSIDVFAIEYSDIKENHRVLIGIDPFTNIQVQRSALRHQLEFELRGSMLRLQRHYLETNTPQQFAQILAQSLSTFSALFRTVLRILGETAPSTKKDTWNALNRHVPLDMAALEKIWDLRDDGLKLDTQAADDLYQRLVRIIDLVINFVDAKKLGGL